MSEPVRRKAVASKEWDFGDGYTPKWHSAVILECGHALPLAFQIAKDAARDAVEIPCGICTRARDTAERQARELSEVFTVARLIDALKAYDPNALVYVVDDDTDYRYGLNRVEDEQGAVALSTDFKVRLTDE